MVLSYKIKRLLLISFVIIILALASDEGAKQGIRDTGATVIHTIYPRVPKELDPSIIDPDLDSANAIPSKVILKPSVTPKPLISAEAYLVKNLETGEVYSEFNSRRIFPIASLSKLVVALVVLHSMPVDQKVTVTQTILDAGYGEAGHLKAGEAFSTTELMYPMLLESSNDAAEAFAESYGYPAFMEKMNEFVKGLGMTSTSFKDPSGLSSGNAGSASDLFTLAQYLYRSEMPLLGITRETTFAVASTTEHEAHTWRTINPFPLDPHFIGGKTGRTNEAKESMISLFRYEHGGTSYPIAVIVLRSDFSNRELDSSVLFEKFLNKIGTN